MINVVLNVGLNEALSDGSTKLTVSPRAICAVPEKSTFVSLPRENLMSPLKSVPASTACVYNKPFKLIVAVKFGSVKSKPMSKFVSAESSETLPF